MGNSDIVEVVEPAAIAARPGEETALVTLYPQPGAPIVRALVVTTKRGLSVHFEAASDGTLLVRIT
jgi:hypothetical protein